MIPVVIPVKPLDHALRRLSEVLSADERRALQAAMLTDVLGAAAGVSNRIVLVTRDAVVSELARGHGARIAPDNEPPAGINAAVARGIEAAAAEAVLVVMGDLPCATTGDLLQVVASAATGVTLAASHDGTGTNAMLLRPPTVIATAFGAGSLARHLEAADAAGQDATVVTAPGLMLDIDTPADLAALVRLRADSHAGRLCGLFELDQRIGTASTR